MSSATFADVRLNGVSMPEAGLNAAIAGHFNVPVVMLSGDDAITKEAAALLPGLETATVKWAYGFHSARTLTPEAACARVREAAKKAIGRAKDFKPYRVSEPVTLDLRFKNYRPAELLGLPSRHRAHRRPRDPLPRPGHPGGHAVSRVRHQLRARSGAVSCRGILPPQILTSIVENGTPQQRRRALATLAVSERLRGRTRDAARSFWCRRRRGRSVAPSTTRSDRTRLPGALVRSEGDPASDDVAVNEAYDGAGATDDLYRDQFRRDSIDGRGMRIDSTVHYGVQYDNAFWDGAQMVYGDGDGELFERFTKSIDVIGHELTHGVTDSEAALEYHDQPGALNESFSDVFGSLVKQRERRQSAAEADWIIGEGLFTASVRGVGLRSLRAPGSAYADPVLGNDPQPAHMSGYDASPDDNGGVHVNSGIPNHAFYLAAVSIGGFAWEKAGRIWYVALTERLRKSSDFAAAAEGDGSRGG